MIQWTESHDTGSIILLVLGGGYVLAAIILVAAVVASRHRIASDLKATSPVMLTSVIAGLLIAFLASHVWSNADRAHAYVAQEASAIREALILADVFPGETRSAFGGAIRDYLHFAENEDWPAMNEGRADLRRPSALNVAIRTVLSFVPTQPGQQLAQQRALVALEQAFEARRGRITLSQAVIAPIQWLVVIMLASLVLVTIGIVHIDRPRTAAINLFIFSTAVSVSLALLMVHNRPFASGGISVAPTALLEIQP